MFARSYIKARRLRYCTCVKAFKLEKKPSSIQVARSLRQFLRTDAAPNTVLGSLSSTRLPGLLASTYLRTWALRRSPTISDEARGTYARQCFLRCYANIQARCQRLPTSAPGVPNLSTPGSSTQTPYPYPASTVIRVTGIHVTSFSLLARG